MTAAKPMYPVSLSRVLALAISVTVLIVAWMCWQLFHAYQLAKADLPRALKMEGLRAKFNGFDELKSTAARTAAATGDPHWEKRYREIESELDAGLEEAKLLRNENPGVPDETDYLKADTILDEVELHAFELIHQGRLAEAQALLNGDDYKKQEKTYSDGLEQLGNWLRRTVDGKVAQMQQQTLWSIVVAVSSTLILLLCWGYILAMMRRWQSVLEVTNRQLSDTTKQATDSNCQLTEKSKQLETTNAQLNAQSAQLEEANRRLSENSKQLEGTNQQLIAQSNQLEAFSQELDKKVEARTMQLKNSELALLNMMNDAVRSRENVQKALDALKREVDERKKVEDQLAQSQKMEAIGQLAGGVAHDYNNQLSVVLGYSNMLEQQVADPKLRRFAQNISTAAKRSADLTQKLLVFSRKGQMQTAPVDMHSTLSETIEMLERSLDKRITLVKRLEADTAVMIGNSSNLQNALLNLGINARDAMPNGGTLTYETENVTLNTAFCVEHRNEIVPGRYLRIVVSDTGCGMSDEVKRHLFEPFFTTKPVGKGTGLGLASVYGTVKQHAGVLTVESELGVGTSFTLYLPLADQSMPQTPTAIKSTRDTRHYRILAVEDEEILRTMLVYMLAESGHELHEEENGKSAVAYYEKHWQEIDLVILDMVMPEMNGHQTFLAMKKINPNIKAVLATGYSLNSEVQAVLDDGVLDFLQKPFEPSQLQNMIVKVMKL